MTLTREEMFERNLALARKRLLQMIENPGKMEVIPQGARVVNLPRDDPELLEANLQLVMELAKDGDERPIMLIPEVGEESPEASGS
ncbi:MAG TPA: hypothetical protein EYP55_10010 [Anaerolineae bacterium]|nr:hypothetical protein [Anaerolineae bacterium]